MEIVKELNDKTLAGILDAVFTINQDNRITFFNRAAEELWGVQRDNILGKDISTVLPPDGATANENYLGNYFKAKDSTLVAKRTEVFIVDKNGERTNVLTTLSEASTGERYTLTAFIQKIEVELF